MHELGITQNILSIALRHAEQVGATRITRLNLVIGDLSSIAEDSVRFYWDAVSRGTIAEGAELHFEQVPAMFRCRNCEVEFSPVEQDLACPDCGAHDVIMLDGNQFHLDSIDVET
jgi:hydrogenase nickel incorporation protein HypA/HybF